MPLRYSCSCLLRAQRERFRGGAVEVLERDDVAAALAVRAARLPVVPAEVPLRERQHHGREPLLFLARDVLRPPPGRDDEGFGQPRPERADDERRELVLRVVPYKKSSPVS
eukprot:29006-Pelagococcus_subviridis.AAC.4